MNTSILYLTVASIIAMPTSGAPSVPKITVRPAAAVTSTFFTLADIADITSGDGGVAKQLASTVVGRSPLPGETRPLSRGDIRLKLRQAGIDPLTVDIEGAGTTTVSTTSSSPAVATKPEVGSTSNPTDPQEKPAVEVKAGDQIDLILVDGPVSVRTKAIAVSTGAQGDSIVVRRDGAVHPINAVVTDNDQARLED